jgi:hypothetical protein
LASLTFGLQESFSCVKKVLQTALNRNWILLVSMRRSVALLVVLVFAASPITMAHSIWAQTTPSVPEFTLKYVDNSRDYYVPPVTTTSIDPYTGNKTVTTQPGYTQHVEDKSIEVIIKNQPLIPVTNGNESFHLYFDVRTSPHFVVSWTDLYANAVVTHESAPYVSSEFIQGYPPQSDSEFTVLSYAANNYPANAQVDFQVATVLGHDSQQYVPNYAMPPDRGGVYEHAIAFDGVSEWSSTQTITIPANTTSPTPSQSVSPSPNLTPSVSPSSSPTLQPTLEPSRIPNNAQEDFTSTVIIIGLVIAVIVLVGLLIYVKKIKK